MSRRLSIVVLSMAMTLVACKRSEAPEPDPTPSPRPTTSATPTSSPTASASSAALQSAIAEAEKDVPASCSKADRVLLPGAAMLLYRCGPSDRVVLVAPGGSRTLEASHVALEPSVHGFWTPMGADRKFAAFGRWKCGAPDGCEGETDLHELVGDRFEADLPIALPWTLRPAAQVDVDHDGAPDLVVPFWSLPLAHAPATCSPADEASIEHANEDPHLVVDGVVSWSAKAKTFTPELASFASWYAMRLSGARSLAKHLSVTDAGTCVVETLRTAAEIAIYGRALGEPASKLDVEADAVASWVGEWAGVRARIGAQPALHLVETR